MGTDIHGFFQKYDTNLNLWIDIESDYDEKRDYYLFSILANIRNFNNFVYIDLPRGLPESIYLDEENLYKTDSLSLWRSRIQKEISYPEDNQEIWLGDHSHTWLSDDEMIEWYSSPKINEVDGLILYSEYPQWDKETAPNFDYALYDWNAIELTEDEYLQGKVGAYVRVYWQQDVREYMAYFFDEVIRLKELHGKVRFVFGFDS